MQVSRHARCEPELADVRPLRPVDKEGAERYRPTLHAKFPARWQRGSWVCVAPGGRGGGSCRRRIRRPGIAAEARGQGPKSKGSWPGAFPAKMLCVPLTGRCRGAKPGAIAEIRVPRSGSSRLVLGPGPALRPERDQAVARRRVHLLWAARRATPTGDAGQRRQPVRWLVLLRRVRAVPQSCRLGAALMLKTAGTAFDAWHRLNR